MKCKNCGTHNSDQALKCVNCNAPLDGSMVVERSSSGSGSSGKNVTCKNCKAINPADALKCHQCNAPLVGSMVVESGRAVAGGQVICKNCKADNPADALRCHQCNAPLDGSLVIRNQEKPSDARIDKSTTAIHRNAPEQKICPYCSYPNQAIADVCVMCSKPLTPDTVTKKEKAKADTPPARQRPSTARSKSMDMTINPWAEQPVVPDSYVLVPLKSDFTGAGEPISLNGEEVNLNRDLLDPGNMTITSSSQAVMRNAGGKWSIEDKSNMQTTFVKVTGSHELNDGDIILMGNKMFKFTKES